MKRRARTLFPRPLAAAAPVLASLSFLVPTPRSAAEAVPVTPDSLRAALARRRQESPPLAVVLRVARGGSSGEEETEEDLIAYRWEPDDAAGAPAPAPLPPLPPPLDAILASLDPPLLQPEALRIRELRCPRAAAAPRQRTAARRMPMPEGHIVVGPPSPPPRRPQPNEVDLAHRAITLSIDHPAGPVEAVLDASTLVLERLAWGRGSDRILVLVESVRPAGDATPGPGIAMRKRPPARPALSARCLLRVALQATGEPRGAAVFVEGFTDGIADGNVVDLRVRTSGDDLELGPWRREAGRWRCAVHDGRFEATIQTGIDELVAGRVSVAAIRIPGEEPLVDQAIPVPADLWRRTLVRDLRSARALQERGVTGRPTDARLLAALARTEAWPLLPSTRRAIERLLQSRASGSAGSDEAGTGNPAGDFRLRAACEARWAILERAAAAPCPLPEPEAVALRRALADAPPASEADLDASIAAYIEAAAAPANPATRPGPPDDLKRRLRASCR